ncbi:MAG: hypothetical protein HQ582_13885 [Planctomycetes bacterium]|nr:hypothetical protein [Planctomycetota bacterium]
MTHEEQPSEPKQATFWSAVTCHRYLSGRKTQRDSLQVNSDIACRLRKRRKKRRQVAALQEDFACLGAERIADAP